MPSRRVVQDSDEEDNAGDSPVPPSITKHPSSSAPNTKDGASSESSQSKRSIPPSGPSTGSTDLLNGEINDAYKKLLEPSTSRSSRASLPSSGSLPASKRRAMSDLVQDTVKKRKITYSTRKSQGDSFMGGSSDEEPVKNRKRARSNGTDPYSKGGLEGALECPSTSGRSSDCAGKLNENTQSSTVVRANENESRSDQALAATEASIPPPASRSCESVKHHSHSSEESTIPFKEQASSLPPPLEDHKSFKKAQATSSADSKHGRSNSTTPRAQTWALTDLKSPEIILGEEVPPSSSAPTGSPIKRQRIGSICPADGSLGRRKEMDGGHDELSLSAASPPHGKGGQGKRPETTDFKAVQLDNSGPDNLVPDLPQERYQPRPSRSRSALTSDELLIPEDFSQRPEALAKSKGKTKRRKTTDLEGSKQEHGNDLPEFAPITSKKGPKGDRGDDVHDEKVISTDGDNHEHREGIENTNREPARGLSPQPAPPKKPRGRPKKDNAASHPILDSSLMNAPPTTENSLRGSSSPTKPANASVTHAKRGRKSKKASAATEDNLVAPPEMHNSKGSAVVPGQVLVESNHNIQVSSTSELGVTEKHATPDTSMALSKDSDESSTEARHEKRPQDAKVEEHKELVKRSPITQEGKSVYRIGLSKRQRIPSLLRMVRKD
ncbi:MAG: hypothetical protein Q9173_006639 [Seirophora scorigena]